MIQNEKFWEAIARGMEAENEKMELFIRHNYSRGAAREAILRNLLRSVTRAPYLVTSGFVCAEELESDPSRQCDVLVYDPRISRPYYDIDEFSVVPENAALFVFEVKSYLNEEALKETIAVKKSLRKFHVPVGLFAYSGEAFMTFCKHLVTAMKANAIRDMPECIVVHARDRNYIGIRPFGWANEPGDSHYFECYCAINLPAAEKVPSFAATTSLLTIYDTCLREYEDGEPDWDESNLGDAEIYGWCESVTITRGQRMFITPKGGINFNYAVADRKK